MQKQMIVIAACIVLTALAMPSSALVKPNVDPCSSQTTQTQMATSYKIDTTKVCQLADQVIGTILLGDGTSVSNSDCEMLDSLGLTQYKLACAGAWVGHYDIACGGRWEPDCTGFCGGTSPGQNCMDISGGFSGSSDLSCGVVVGAGFVAGDDDYCPGSPGGDNVEDHYAWHDVGVEACHSEKSEATNTQLPGSSTAFAEDCFVA